MKNKLTKKQIEEIMDYCYKNNTIETKYPHLKIAITDGGWVNVMKFQRFLESEEELK